MTPHDLLAELGLTATMAPLLKFPGQPRVPKGSGRSSGQFDSGHASVVPVFLDTTREHDAKVKEDRALLRPEPHSDSITDGHALDLLGGGGAPLPVPTPGTEKDKDGPACPPMRTDRPNGANAAGDREEARVARLVNPSNPTPKQTPETPDVSSMAYYLPVPSATGEVALDDCKRTSEPTPALPDLKKGDVVEAKTEGSASLIMIDGLKARENFDRQFERQINSIRLENKGRSLFVCVGSQSNVKWFNKNYGFDNPEAHFVVCQDHTS